MGAACGCAKEPGTPCLRCARHGRSESPNETDPKFKNGAVCSSCYSAMNGDEKLVFDHNSGNHDACKGVANFPESELEYESPAYYDQRRAEWKHHHGDHSLCLKKYYLGCTDEEKAEQADYEKRSHLHDGAQAKTVSST